MDQVDAQGRRIFDEKGRYRAFRCTYEEFEKFLSEHPKVKYDMDCPHQCAGAMCTGNELSEQYCGPEWFNQFQRKVKRGIWTGKELLSVLHDVRPHTPAKVRMSKAKRK